MARIATIGGALQDIYLIDRDDFVSTEIGDQSIFGQLIIGTKVDIDNISYEIGGGGANVAISMARHGHESILFANLANDSDRKSVV